MFQADKLSLPPESRSLRPRSGIGEAGGRRSSYFEAAIVACSFLFGVGSFVAMAQGMDPSGFERGAQMAVLQFAITRKLHSVGASSAQEAKAHDIVAAKFAKVVSGLDQFQALRERAIGIIAAPSFDRDAFEKLRSQTIAHLDAESKLAVAGLADIADVLEPGQRAALAAQLESGPSRGAKPPGGSAFGSDND